MKEPLASPTISCDVLVVGGGAAGIAAAVAAGRAGAQVLLLERYGFLGGLATAAEVGTVCGLYLRDTANAQAIPVSGGFVREYASRLQRATGREPIRLETGLWVLPFSPAVLARLADALVGESKNIRLVLHATVAEAKCEGPRLAEVRALAWNQPLTVRPGAIVDCSGEATAAALAGASVEDGAADQAPSLVFALENVAPDFVKQGLLEVRREVRRAVEMGRLPATCERLALVPGTGSDGHLSLKLNLVPANSDCPVWQRVTDWEREARGLVDVLQRFLVENTASCRNARRGSVAPQIGIRSGHRIRGRATLADQEVLSARKFACGVARGCWPMERWGHGRRPEMIFFDERDYYEIPMDCLRPIELDNVLAAGRCLSAAAGAMSSARVIGTALATGWAAGTAAAFQTQGRPLDDSVETIRRQMSE
jgi:hypothetical protein